MPKIALLGAGQMGGAMLKGWLASGVPADDIFVLDPAPPSLMAEIIHAHSLSLNPSAFETPDILIVAVKPQIADGVLVELAPHIGKDTLIISIMAGKTTHGIASHFYTKQPIIRTIPNTPASVGRGITAAFANEYVTSTQRESAYNLLLSLGKVEWVEHEDLIDVATAVSGSGPAYVFHMVEALAKAGEAQGLPPELAMNLARATVEGAGELLWQNPQVEAARLRENVTSPKGTTYAALQVLMGEEGLTELMTKAVAAATARSKELAS